MLLYKIVYSQIIVIFFFTKLLIFDKYIYVKIRMKNNHDFRKYNL